MICDCCKKNTPHDEFYLDSKDYIWNSLCRECRHQVNAIIRDEHKIQMSFMTLDERKAFYSPEIKIELPPWITPVAEIVKFIQESSKNISL